MRIQLPASRSKHYLTGIDWIIHALDHASEKYSACGHSFLIAVVLSGGLNPHNFNKSFSRFCLLFPELRGRAARDLNLAPYWRPDKNPKPPEFDFRQLEAAESFDVFEKELEIPFRKGQLPVRAVLVNNGSKQVLGFVFDHRMFDARGAELFLKDFQDWYLSGEIAEVKHALPAAACLDRWEEQFAAGRKINRARIAREKSLVRSLEMPGAQSRTNHFEVRTFNEQESSAVFSKASKQAGPFMFLPYSLACAVLAADGLFKRKGRNAGDFVIPVTRDMRTGLGAETLFNHLSFLFFQVTGPQACDFEQLLPALKIQMYEQIKERMPEAFAEAAMLMRILPKQVLSRGLQNEIKPAASFSFAVLGDSAYPHDHFMNASIENIVHMPRVPPSPGLGIFYSQYRGRLNVTLSYLGGLLSETEAGQLIKQVIQP